MLYHVEWCPECEVVRDKLTELALAYEDIVVPDARAMRHAVFDVSGQYYVPVLKDDSLVLSETRDILAYLDDRYGAAGSGPAAVAKFAARAGRTPDTLGDDDQHPSCRVR